jgi:hypothetical protein
MQTTFGKLKQGEAFKFFEDGAVYVRCRGGYRPGLGGQLAKMYPAMPVFLYQGVTNHG